MQKVVIEITKKEVAKEEIRSTITVTAAIEGFQERKENKKMLIVRVIALENYSWR